MFVLSVIPAKSTKITTSSTKCIAEEECLIYVIPSAPRYP